ncbi:hypothetical protein BsWGS_24745 [Bradybaena similaris]
MPATMFDITLLLLLIGAHHLSASQYIRACSYNPERGHTSTRAPFSVRDIDFTLCTHYIYCFAEIDSDEITIRAANPSLEEGQTGTYKLFNDGKKDSSNVKTIISVMGMDDFDDMQLRTFYTKDSNFQTFATNVLSFLRDKCFDGFNIYWQTTDEEMIRDAFPKLLQALRGAFDSDRDRGPLLLTLTGFSSPSSSLGVYNMTVVRQKVDYIFLPAIGVRFNNYASFLDPLYDNPSQLIMQHNINANAKIQNLASLGLPHFKMVLGVTALGHYLKLKNAAVYEPGAPVQTTQLRGPKYCLANLLAYPEVCEMMKTAMRYYDDVQKSPYLVENQTWVGYTDVDSLKDKIDFMKLYGLAGLEFSLVDQDDYTGDACSSGKYPLLSFIRNELAPSTTLNTTAELHYISFTNVGPRAFVSTTAGSVGARVAERRVNLITFVVVGLLLLPVAVVTVWVARCFIKQPQ